MDPALWYPDRAAGRTAVLNGRTYPMAQDIDRIVSELAALRGSVDTLAKRIDRLIEIEERNARQAARPAQVDAGTWVVPPWSMKSPTDASGGSGSPAQ